MPHHSGAELPGAQALRQMAAQSDSRGLFSDRAPDPAYAGLFLNRELSWLAIQPPRAGRGGRRDAAGL